MKSADPYEVFLDIYLQELMESSDAEILEGIDADAEKAAGLALLAAAKADAGRRRLARARAAIAQMNTAGDVLHEISPDDARHFIREAVNDPRFTLAARQLDELSDEDVLRVYTQIKQLQASFGEDSDRKK